MTTPPPTDDPLLFSLALLFLLGVVLSLLSIVPALQERFPRLLLYGFMLSVAAALLVLVVGLLRH